MMTTGALSGFLTVRPERSSKREDFVAIATLVNRGSESVILNLAPLTSASLALEIVDEAGSPVRLPPPPVPGGPPQRASLAPGEGETLELPSFVPQWFPAGAYRARLRYVYEPSEHARNEWSG